MYQKITENNIEPAETATNIRSSGTNKSSAPQKMPHIPGSIRWLLVFYDTLIYALCAAVLLYIYPSNVTRITKEQLFLTALAGYICVCIGRFIMGVYKAIWRYGNVTTYMRLIVADVIAGILFLAFRSTEILPRMTFPRVLSLFTSNLLLALSARILYQFFYLTGNRNGWVYRVFRKLIYVLTGIRFSTAKSDRDDVRRIQLAIVGAGQEGVMLADELLNNPAASYRPVCFIDTNPAKVGREIYGIPVIGENSEKEELSRFGVQEIVVAISSLDSEKLRTLYEHYKKMGFRMKVYDFQDMQSAKGGKRRMRDFEIEELLFRSAKDLTDEHTVAYYRNKTVLITGGGGSIGSELCRQIAKMQPKRLVILDVCENGAYDVQQELRIAYGSSLDLQVEIISVCDRNALDKVFAYHHPDIVLHAAAHKHVPLMEHNVCEAVQNNIFGTLNVVEIAEKHGVSRFIMISTDKAVNPTNVMGATKRMCEMIVLNRHSSMLCSATRFGNVLGSAGSVIPLFKRQIAAGGPVTITDKRIIRYFMTIPEASQLVLQSGAMAKNRELFVLDMGKPVKIIDLAESMIRLSGLEPYQDIDIVETGLRPGEKLYEELLIKSATLSQTENSLIFVEQDAPLSLNEMNAKLDGLRSALETGEDTMVRTSLKEVVPTYREAEEVNIRAEAADEMKNIRVS